MSELSTGFAKFPRGARRFATSLTSRVSDGVSADEREEDGRRPDRDDDEVETINLT